jgi:hypothetical protein
VIRLCKLNDTHYFPHHNHNHNRPYSHISPASHVAAAVKDDITLKTGQAIFFSRGVLHEAFVAPNEAGRSAASAVIDELQNL